MPSLALSESVPELNPEDAVQFLDVWHGDTPGALIAVTQRPASYVGPSMTNAFTVDQVKGALSAGLDDLVYAGNAQWNVYHSVATLREKPARGKRGSKDLVATVPGVWLDLDVHEGAFSNQEHCLELVRVLGVAPTITVGTGTGGVHAYWKVDGGLSGADCEDICLRWWCYAQQVAQTGGVAIDKLVDSTRIMRLPGTLRWPKGNETPTQVRVLDATGPGCSRNDLVLRSEGAWQAHFERTRATFQAVDRSKREALQAVKDLTGWGALYVVSNLEDIFNERTTWASILEPKGWTCIGECPDQSFEWARPGDFDRAATTDWPESPDTMSLLSSSAATGLADLKDAGVALTKYRVFVRLWWNDDEAGFVRAYMEQLKEDGLWQN